MGQNERRAVGRVAYQSEGVAVVCDTQTVIHVKVYDIGPGGVGLTLPAGSPELVGKDMILVTGTMIMYADVVRQEPLEGGGWWAGLAARRFSPDVLQYLFESIELKSKYEEDNSSGQI